MTRLIYIALTVVFSFFASFALAKEKSPKKLLKEAYYYYEYFNYGYALPYFESYLKQDTSNNTVNFDAAECYFFASSLKDKAIPLYKKTKLEKPIALLRLGILYHAKAEFDSARLYLKSYIDSQPYDSIYTEVAINTLGQIERAEIAMNNPQDAEIIVLSDSINSIYPDYAPIVSPDGDFMYFTSRREGGVGNLKDPNGDYFEDIYVSRFDNGEWGKAQNLGKPINSDTHDACLGITSDMRTMFLYRTNRTGLGGNIYESHLSNGKWSRPKKIEAAFNLDRQDVKVISLNVAPDSISYYYVSNEPGGYGGTDIYKVVRFGPNFWSKPMNLGPEINTPEDEDSPFLHYDGKTMYFSSKGHDSYGSYDVYKATLQEDESWGNVQNIGYPISTVADDRTFMKMPDGRTSYFSTKAPGSNTQHDIYIAYMPKRDVNYAIVRGKVTDAEETAVVCDLRVLHADTKKLVGVYRPNTVTGKFVLLLPPSGEYYIEVIQKNNIVEEIEFSVPEKMSLLFDQLTIILHKQD